MPYKYVSLPWLSVCHSQYKQYNSHYGSSFTVFLFLFVILAAVTHSSVSDTTLKWEASLYWMPRLNIFHWTLTVGLDRNSKLYEITWHKMWIGVWKGISKLDCRWQTVGAISHPLCSRVAVHSFKPCLLCTECEHWHLWKSTFILHMYSWVLWKPARTACETSP